MFVSRSRGFQIVKLELDIDFFSSIVAYTLSTMSCGGISIPRFIVFI